MLMAKGNSPLSGPDSVPESGGEKAVRRGFPSSDSFWNKSNFGAYHPKNEFSCNAYNVNRSAPSRQLELVQFELKNIYI